MLRCLDCKIILRLEFFVLKWFAWGLIAFKELIMAKIIRFAHPSYQFVLIGILIFFIFKSVDRICVDFYTSDQLPVVQLFKESDQQIFTKSIECGFYLKNFIEFNHINNKFVINGTIWFEAQQEIMSVLDKFAVGKSEIIYKSEPVFSEIDGKSIAEFDLRLEFPANLTYKYFPLEDHLISFSISNLHLAKKGFALKAQDDNFQISPNLYVDGWKIFQKRVFFGYEKIKIGRDEVLNNRVVFSLDFLQTSKRLFMLIITPLIICMFLSFMAFSIDFVRFEPLMNLVLSSIAAIIGYRFVIETLSPKVSYFIFSDVFFLLILLFTCVAFFLNAFYREKIVKVIDWVVISIYLLFLISWFLMLKLWF